MKRFFVVISGLCCLAGAGFAVYHFLMRYEAGQSPMIWLAVALPIGLAVVGLVLLAWACSDNFYHVTSGTVVGHYFTPAHTTTPIWIPGTPGTGSSPATPGMMMPGHSEPDDWAIQIQDEHGRTGVLHFSSNVFNDYPMGSQYPKA